MFFEKLPCWMRKNRPSEKIQYAICERVKAVKEEI